MKLLIGLGNPGNKYKNNRHNVGYHFVDFLINKLTNIKLTNSAPNPQSVNTLVPRSSKSEVGLINNKKFLISKTDVFMNQSGLFVKKMLDKHQNIDLDDLYITHDDLDIPLGKFKIEKSTGPKLHNGIKSIEETLKTKDFWRIRIGVDNRKQNSWIDGEKYVLSDFTQDENTIINKVFIEIINKLEVIKAYI